ncbi:MAG: polysaccharide deacetylase family protein [Dethiobacteria bacterium]|jgi:peptidoglycan/xylan/chitin deacetylase (PgdA/CDA1 family)
MLWPGLRIFVGTMVFISIFFYPLPLFAPAKNMTFDLWVHTQPARQIQPAFVQPSANQEAELPKPESTPPQTLQPGEGNPAVLPQQTATTETSAGETLQEENLQIKTGSDKEEFLPAETLPVIYRLDVQDKVALTFDDGPCPEMTEQYLAVLQAYGIQATFFIIGRQAGLHPETVGKIIAQGSELGSHSWKHDQMDRLTTKQIAADLQETAAQIYELWGQEITFFRPPYGRGSPDVLAAAKELGQKLVYWDVDPRDWKEPPPEEIVKRVMEQVQPGSIIILHEGRPNTLAALPEIIQGLQACGLQPVSVSTLLTARDNSASSSTADTGKQ